MFESVLKIVKDIALTIMYKYVTGSLESSKHSLPKPQKLISTIGGYKNLIKMKRTEHGYPGMSSVLQFTCFYKISACKNYNR